MNDARWDQLAEILVNYSTRVEQGERVMINMMEPETEPAVEAVYRSVVRAGGYPEVYYSSDFLKRIMITSGTTEQISWVPEVESYGMEWCDCYIGLRGARNPFELGELPTDKLTLHRAAMGKVSTLRNKHTRWVLVKIPNEHFAQQAGTSYEETMRMFFDSTLRDWQQDRRRLRELAEVFQAAKAVRVKGKGTDITFSTAGRSYLAGDGEFNMPDGEIYTAPVEDSVNGTVWFEAGMYANRKIPGISLELVDGRVVGSRADDNDEFLTQILNMDSGSRRFGEFGVGLNSGIQRWTGEVLFDEKIGGTIHFALGRSYEECGGLNHSSLHWDIVKDLREEGTIELDGKTVFEDGNLLV
jgi:aminopeptidase